MYTHWYKVTLNGEEVATQTSFCTYEDAENEAEKEIESIIKSALEDGEELNEDDFEINIYSEKCEVSPAWSERHLNTLGMSMSNFM